MVASCRVELFGGLRILCGDRTTTRFRTRKAAALLAVLAYRRDRPHPRETLIEMLWRWANPGSGRQNLSQALYSLRQQLEPPGIPAGTVLVADRTQVQLNPQAVTTDVLEFETALHAAERATDAITKERELAEAVALYRGELLSGLYEPWIPAEQVRLSEEFVGAVVGLARLLARRGELTAAIAHLRQAIVTEPLQEEPYRELIQRLAERGEHRAALKVYQDLEHILAEELGEPPSAAARGLARDVERRAREEPGVAVATIPAQTRPSRHRRRAELPSGIVTVLLVGTGDVGSGGERAIAQALREEFRRYGGIEIENDHPAVAAVFEHAGEALNCAATCQLRLLGQSATGGEPPAHPRMAIHTADLAVDLDGRYRGGALQRVERLLDAAHPAQILCSEASAGLLRYGLNGGLRLHDLGVYRLHGATASERIFQLDYRDAEDRFPPLNAEAGHAGHLPLRLTRFFGRRREIERLRAMLSGDARLVTMVGPPGCGKTRLAIEVAAGLEEIFLGAVWFVPLADLREGEILDRALDPLGIRRSPEMKPIDLIAAALGSNPALIVFDNFEHLVEKAVEVRDLLERVPLVRCLVTSRRRLSLTGEREFPIAPLPVPGDVPFQELSSNESVQLFVDRAQAAAPDFQLTPRNADTVAALCRRLEGVPLAIELAAARSSTHGLGHIIEQLEKGEDLATRSRDAEERHRSLRQAIEWSYRLLAPELQRFFAGLSVFRGGWTVEAGEVVCAEPLAADYLVQLVELSLVEPDRGMRLEPRHRMLEMIRQYAARQLRTSGDELKVRDSHFRYFHGLAGRFTNLTDGKNAATVLDRWDLEHENMLSALDWWQRSPDGIQDAMDMAGKLGAFWQNRGHSPLGRAILDRVLSLDSEARPTLARAWALNWASYLRPKDSETARRQFSEQLAIARLLNHKQLQGHALRGLGLLAMRQGDYILAKELLTEAAEVYRSQGDGRGADLALVMCELGALCFDQGDLDESWTIFSDQVDLCRKEGYHLGLICALQNLAATAGMKRDVPLADSLYGQALAEARIHSRPAAAFTLCNWGYIAYMRGDAALAISRNSEALEMARQLDATDAIALATLNLGFFSQLTGDTEQARAHLVEFLRLGRPVVRQRMFPTALEFASRLASTRADQPSCPDCATTRENAVRLYAAAQGIRSSMGLPPEEDWAEEHVTALRDAVEPETFAAAWAEGSAMTFDQAIAYARDWLESAPMS